MQRDGKWKGSGDKEVEEWQGNRRGRKKNIVASFINFSLSCFVELFLLIRFSPLVCPSH